jgi:DNA-binding transcriptional regulator YiaG
MSASHDVGASYVPGLPAAAVVEPRQTSFACQIRDLRQRYGRKQAWLASAIGCTDAAVSYWESGRRLPQGHLLGRIVTALKEVGAPPAELVALRRTWREEKMSRLMREWGEGLR